MMQSLNNWAKSPISRLIDRSARFSLQLLAITFAVLSGACIKEETRTVVQKSSQKSLKTIDSTLFTTKLIATESRPISTSTVLLEDAIVFSTVRTVSNPHPVEIICVDLDGLLRWQVQQHDTTSVTLLRISNGVLAISENEVNLIDPASGMSLSSIAQGFQFPAVMSDTSVAAFDDQYRLVIITLDSTTALDVKIKASWAAFTPKFCPIRINGQSLLVVAQDNTIIRYDLEAQNVAWSYMAQGELYAAPTIGVDENVAYIMLSDENQLLRLQSGIMTKSCSLSERSLTPVQLLSTGEIIVADVGGNITKYTETLHEVWKLRIESPILVSPIPTANSLVVLTSKIYLVDFEGKITLERSSGIDQYIVSTAFEGEKFVYVDNVSQMFLAEW